MGAGAHHIKGDGGPHINCHHRPGCHIRNGQHVGNAVLPSVFFPLYPEKSEGASSARTLDTGFPTKVSSNTSHASGTTELRQTCPYSQSRKRCRTDAGASRAVAMVRMANSSRPPCTARANLVRELELSTSNVASFLSISGSMGRGLVYKTGSGLRKTGAWKLIDATMDRPCLGVIQT